MPIQSNPYPCGSIPACCNGGTINDRLKATLQVASGSTCPCADGVTIDLVLKESVTAGTSWSGSGPIGTCGTTITLHFACTGNASVFALNWRTSGGPCDNLSGYRAAQDSGGCSPTQDLNVTYNAAINLSRPCCDDMPLPNLYQLNVVITE